MRTSHARAALLLGALAAGSSAGAQPQPIPPARTITVQNLAPYPRTQWASASVAFSEGAVPGSPALHVGGRPTVWQPFGARWPDGSLRQALCLFPVQINAMATLELPLAGGRGPEVPAAAWPALELDVEVSITLAQGDDTARAQPTLAEVLEENAARRVELWRTRIGNSGLLFELLVTRWSGQGVMDASAALWFSDPRTKAMQVGIGSAAVRCRGHALLLRHAGLHAMHTTFDQEGSDTVLLQATSLGDGQGIRRAGVLVPPLAGDSGPQDQTTLASGVAPLLAATRWNDSGAFGPFGFVPEPPPGLRDAARLRAAGAQRHRLFAARSRQPTGDPFVTPVLGLARDANQTGDQEDFGVVKLESVAGTGMPSPLYEAEASVLQEACRPVHVFEADGSPVRAKDHPDWATWVGRTHWHCDGSTDRLGKPCPAPDFETHGWTGKDRQHWSSLYLCSYYLLTGAPWARREIENEVQLYLAGQTVDPRFSASGTGTPRAAGRTLLTASWLWLCTGDPALLERMNARLDRVYAVHWVGAGIAHDKVRPFWVGDPDVRMIQGKGRFWTPWQDALAAIGFAAAHRVTQNPHAAELADALALNVLRYAWRTGDGRPPMIATALRWREDGAPITPEELATADPGLVQWADGTAFSVWGIGSVELARQAAHERGLEELEARATAILDGLRARRPPSKGLWFDRFGQWDAVR